VPVKKSVFADHLLCLEQNLITLARNQLR
jgi:predicted transcriptional regulator